MKVVVVKIGSSVIAPGGVVNNAILESLVSDFEEVFQSQRKVVVVTSGAIASGVKVLGLKTRPTQIEQLQAIASVGQIILMNHFLRGFSVFNRRCGQLLLTWDDFERRDRYLNVKRTIMQLLSQGIIPVINENDTVSTDEIKFGDNDKLSALVANLIEAEMLLILSDVEGLFSGRDLVQDVHDIERDALPFVRPHSKTSLTRGGMLSKLEAARITTAAGVKMVIASGKKPHVIQRVVCKQEREGTLFHPAVKKVGAKKRWIVFGKKEKGSLVIDAGAEKAVVHQGKSLLLPGITAVQGDFHKGDAVVLCSHDGRKLAKGIVRYGAAEIRHRKNIQHEVIHRDSLVLVP